MRRNRTFRRRVGGRRHSPLWLRNTGSFLVTNTGGANGNPFGADLVDLRDLNVSAAQRAEAPDLTLVGMRYSVVISFAPGDGIAGTAKFGEAHVGLYVTDRNVGNLFASPSFTTADDARTDWLDVFIDSFTHNGGGGASVLSNGSTNEASRLARIVKVKRKLTGESAIRLSAAFFPHTGTLDQSWQAVIQWSASMLFLHKF